MKVKIRGKLRKGFRGWIDKKKIDEIETNVNLSWILVVRVFPD